MTTGSLPRRSVWLLALTLLLLAGTLRAAEVIPPVPTRYFNDFALTVKPETADRLNRELENFERQTSNQLRVAIYPKLQSDSDLADYCQRVARSWKVGDKEKRNGAILFVFVEDRKMNIQAGYGLEGPLNDATCKDIIADKIAPRFKANDYDGGLTAGVEAMMTAAKGEYQGSGRTEYERQHPRGADTGGGGAGGLSIGTIIFLIVLFLMFSRLFNRRGGGRGGWGGSAPIFIGGLGGGGFGGGGFGGGGGGGGGSSDGGGFASSGGGDFGGGGASGDW